MSASERSRQASGVAPTSVSRATRCSLGATARGGEKRLLDPPKRLSAFLNAGKVDANPFELRNARQPRLDGDLAIVADCHQARRLRAALVDVAPLRISRHHDRRAAPLLEPLMNVAERPIVEARAVEIGQPAGRVKAMRRRAAEARMHHADVHGPRSRRAELRQEAFWRVLLREAHAMHRDVDPAPRERSRFRAAGEDLHRFGQGQLPRDAGFCVVIAANEEGRDARLVEPSQLIGEKPRRFHRRLLAVVEVAGDQKRVDLFGKAEVDHGDESFSRRPANQTSQFGIAQRERRQRRIEVDVGGVNESEGHGLIGARPPKRAKSRVWA